MNLNRSTEPDLTTSPPLLGRCCYGQAVVLSIYLSLLSLTGLMIILTRPITPRRIEIWPISCCQSRERGIQFRRIPPVKINTMQNVAIARFGRFIIKIFIASIRV